MKVYVLTLRIEDSLLAPVKAEYDIPIELLPFLDYERIRASELTVKTLYRYDNNNNYYISREPFKAIVSEDCGRWIDIKEPMEIEVPEELEPFVELPD